MESPSHRARPEVPEEASSEEIVLRPYDESQHEETQNEDINWRSYEKRRCRNIVACRWAVLEPFSVKLFRNVCVGEILCFFSISSIFILQAFHTYDKCLESGDVATVPFVFVFLTAARSSLLTFVIGLPFERAIWWHAYFAVWGLALAAAHGAYCYIPTAPNGLIAILAAFIILLLSIYSPLRRQRFELFYRSHVLFAILFIVTACLHFGSLIWIAALLWGIDLAIRCYTACRYSTTAALINLRADVVRIELPIGHFKYKAGQFVFICIPALSLNGILSVSAVHPVKQKPMETSLYT